MRTPARRAASTPATIVSSVSMPPNSRSISRSEDTSSTAAKARLELGLAQRAGLQALESPRASGVAQEAVAHRLGRSPSASQKARKDAKTSVVSTPP